MDIMIYDSCENMTIEDFGMYVSDEAVRVRPTGHEYDVIISYVKKSSRWHVTIIDEDGGRVGLAVNCVGESLMGAASRAIDELCASSGKI